MDNKPIVALDMDDTLYEFVIPLLNKYNLRYDDWVSYDDINNWDIHQFLKPECKNIFSEFATEGFFEELFIPTSIVGWLSALNMISHIRFVTAGHSETIPWRAALLRRELDFFEDSMLVKLTDKSILISDYFVDDNEATCRQVRIMIPNVKILQISRPWNGSNGYDIDEALAAITKDILLNQGRGYPIKR